MAAILAPLVVVADRVSAMDGRVSIAAVNGPENTVISGTARDVTELVETFAAAGFKSSALRVSHAFHSALIEPMLDEFEAVARSAQLGHRNVAPGRCRTSPRWRRTWMRTTAR